MNVAVHDTRKVVKAAKERAKTVVMGGHSLGGSITTAYATWDFNGKPGAKGLSGLVFIDGAGANSSSTRPLPTAEEAQADVDELEDPASSPFITLVPPLPWIAGVFNATGSTAAMLDPDELSVFGSWALAPANLTPPVPATNAGQYGYAVDATTSPESLALVQSHIGRLAGSGDPRGWKDGELGTVKRAASVFSEKVGMKNQKVGQDGTSGTTRRSSRWTRARSTTASITPRRPSTATTRSTATWSGCRCTRSIPRSAADASRMRPASLRSSRTCRRAG